MKRCNVYSAAGDLKKRRCLNFPSRAQPALLPVLSPLYRPGGSEDCEVNKEQQTEPAKKRESRWDSLPLELLVIVFSFLTGTRDRQALLLTCRTWHTAMCDSSLWRDRCIVIRRSTAPLWLWRRVLEDRQISHVDLTRFDKWASVPSSISRIAKLSLTMTSLDVKVMELPQIMEVATLKHLKHLSVLVKEYVSSAGTPFSDLLVHLPLLSELKIVAIQRGPVCMEKLVHSNLRKLTLENMDFSQCKTESSVLLMDGLPLIEQLIIRKCRIDGEMQARLIGSEVTTKHSMRLSSITLSHSSLQNAPMQTGDFRLISVAELSNIILLNLSYCKMTDQVLYVLVDKMTSLTSLDLSGQLYQ